MWESATECTKCDMLGPGSKAGAQARNGVRTVAPAGPPCPPSRQARVELAWWNRWAQSRFARSPFADASPGRRSARRRTEAGGGVRSDGRRVAVRARGQPVVVPGSECGRFCAVERRFWARNGAKRLLSRPSPGSARHYPVSTAFRSVGAEWSGCGVGGALVEWSGAGRKGGESGRARGRTVPVFGRRGEAGWSDFSLDRGEVAIVPRLVLTSGHL